MKPGDYFIFLMLLTSLMGGMLFGIGQYIAMAIATLAHIIAALGAYYCGFVHSDQSKSS